MFKLVLFTLLASAMMSSATTPPTFKDCPIATTGQQTGLDGIPYAKQKGEFYVCPPCTYIQLIATVPFNCHLGLILDVVCSDGSSPTRPNGMSFQPLGYSVFTQPPGTILVKSKSGFTRAILKKTDYPKGSMEDLGKGYVRKLNLHAADGTVSKIGGWRLEAPECSTGYTESQRREKVVCGKGSKLIGVGADNHSGAIFNLDFLCGKVDQCSQVTQCPRV